MATTRSWNFGDGSALSTAQNPTHTYTAAGTYNVSLTRTVDGGTPQTTTINSAVTVTGSAGYDAGNGITITFPATQTNAAFPTNSFNGTSVLRVTGGPSGGSFQLQTVTVDDIGMTDAYISSWGMVSSWSDIWMNRIGRLSADTQKLMYKTFAGANPPVRTWGQLVPVTWYDSIVAPTFGLHTGGFTTGSCVVLTSAGLPVANNTTNFPTMQLDASGSWTGNIYLGYSDLYIDGTLNTIGIGGGDLVMTQGQTAYAMGKIMFNNGVVKTFEFPIRRGAPS